MPAPTRDQLTVSSGNTPAARLQRGAIQHERLINQPAEDAIEFPAHLGHDFLAGSRKPGSWTGPVPFLAAAAAHVNYSQVGLQNLNVEIIAHRQTTLPGIEKCPCIVSQANLRKYPGTEEAREKV